MSTSEQYTDDLNLEDITSGSTFSQNIENLEGLTSLHGDQQVLIIYIYFKNIFLNIEFFSLVYEILRPITNDLKFQKCDRFNIRSQSYLKIISGFEIFFFGLRLRS